MKANRRFLKGNEEAVSPVIAVILMVAITVVLAATVYVWVSGFGQSGSQSKSIAASGNSAGIITISSVAPNFNWARLKIVVDGDTAYGILANGKYVRDAAWTDTTATGSISAGDTFKVGHRTSGGSLTVSLVDTSANTVAATITVPVSADTTAPTASLGTTCTTRGDPAAVTLSEAGYYTSTTLTPATFFTFEEVAGVAQTLGGTALTLTQAITAVSVDMSAAPDPTDRMQLNANVFFDLAGNAFPAGGAGDDANDCAFA